MGARLKLVSQHGRKIINRRLVITEYSGGVVPRDGHSTTVQNAVAQAMRRILKHDYQGAAVYNENGQLVVTIKRVRHGIMLHGQKRGYL